LESYDGEGFVTDGLANFSQQAAGFGAYMNVSPAGVFLREHSDVPRCVNCIFSSLHAKTTGLLWWKTTKKEWLCSRLRWEPVTGVAIGNGSAEKMRAAGAECGPDGKLFVKS
jgi:hypothetical protein